MKYKGTNKIYFGIGLQEDYQRINYTIFYFYWFMLKHRNPEGEALKYGRDYFGFNIRFAFRIPNIGINI